MVHLKAGLTKPASKQIRENEVLWMLFKPRRIRKAWARNAPQTIGKHVRMPIQTITSVLRVNNKYKPQLEGSPFILFLVRSGFGPKFGTVARKWARWGLGNIPIATKISEHPYFTQNLIHTKFQDDRGRSDEISWIFLREGLPHHLRRFG